ncbi:hypothetical protein HPB48_026303 [Haemaphysalis longicornis]|uniref:Transposase Tc1-like domain-containing protein n=1 Tax=Haemaphysalis longicornis TaxID=44386 RepID=A0A9J6H985_HAELO|nr:hypothetical protein HPB48_026303 [Haemaphysalis longicornis]
MPPRVPHSARLEIIKYCSEGVPQREMCRRAERSMTAVNCIIQAYRQDNDRFDDAPRPGPRSTSEEHDLLIIAAITDDPFGTAGEIRENVSLDISEATIIRRLNEAGLNGCIGAQKPFITEGQRVQRLAFARAHEAWSVDDWAEVVFSDESTFSSRWDQQRRVWRP